MTYKYTSNINCGGCIASVTPVLDEISTIQSWSVDTDHKQKVLTIEAEKLDEHMLKEKLAEIGFQLKPFKGSWISKIWS
ncbi:MAG: heavy-metal-associated domain-containing protein [Bacteroidota bacterium]